MCVHVCVLWSSLRWISSSWGQFMFEQGVWKNPLRWGIFAITLSYSCPWNIHFFSWSPVCQNNWIQPPLAHSVALIPLLAPEGFYFLLQGWHSQTFPDSSDPGSQVALSFRSTSAYGPVGQKEIIGLNSFICVNKAWAVGCTVVEFFLNFQQLIKAT